MIFLPSFKKVDELKVRIIIIIIRVILSSVLIGWEVITSLQITAYK